MDEDFSNLTTEELDDILKSTEYPDSQTGGCVSFAVALDNIVGVDSFPCAFDPGYPEKPLHATVVIDGVVFDSEGSHGKDPYFVEDWWSGLKPNDFNAVIEKAEETGEERWEVFVEYLREEGYANFTQQEELHRIGAVESDVNMYENMLKKSIREYR